MKILASLLAAHAACGITACMPGDDIMPEPEPMIDASPAADLDPRGAWNVTITYDAGPCGLLTDQIQRVITVEPFGYAGYASDVQATAEITCDPSSCVLTFAEVQPRPNVATATLEGVLTMNDQSQISGSGTFKVRDPVGSCDQTWTATGSRACFGRPGTGCL